jgi:hypothetical protein
MPPLETPAIVLAGIALFAAIINGAFGYGFSSLTVPMALVFYTNRILNPAVVLVEVVINFYVLFINLEGVAAVQPKPAPSGLVAGDHALDRATGGSSPDSVTVNRSQQIIFKADIAVRRVLPLLICTIDESVGSNITSMLPAIKSVRAGVEHALCLAK